MENTVNVSLGGYSFTLDAEAYQYMREYLSRLQSMLGRSADAKEIYDSVEERLAELLGSRSQEGRAHSLGDVQWATGQMGAPEDFAEGVEEREAEAAPRGYIRRRLYRDGEGRVVSGVCSGIALRYGLPVWAVRLLFVLFGLYYGVGVLLYFILSLTVPLAITPPQKLEMRGEPVDFSHILEQVKRQYDRARESVRPENVGASSRHAAQRFAEASTSIFGTLLLGVLRVLFVVAGVVLLVGSVLAVVVFSLTFLVGVLGENWPWLPLGGFTEWSLWLPWVWIMHGWWMKLLLYGLVIIPLGALFVLGLHFLAHVQVRRRFSFAVLSVWLLLVCGFGLGLGARWLDIRREGEYAQLSVRMPLVQADTLCVVGDTQFDYEEVDEDGQSSFRVYSDGGASAMMGRVELMLEQSQDGRWSYQVFTKARGRSRAEAVGRAKALEYTPALIGRELHLPSMMQAMGRTELVEKVQVVVRMPKGGYIRVDPVLEGHTLERGKPGRKGATAFLDFNCYCRMGSWGLVVAEDEAYSPEETSREGEEAEADGLFSQGIMDGIDPEYEELARFFGVYDMN